MEHHPNRNGFTWKRMKPTACFTAQYNCDRDGLHSQRGCRKHVNNKHSWFFYFDEKPNLNEITDSLKVARNVSMVNTIQDQTSETTKHAVKLLPSFSLSCDIGEVFTKWLTGSGGGCNKDRAAQQIVTRCFKFLRFCCEDEEELTFDVVDFSLCSPNSLFKFIDYLQDECKLGHGGRLGYIDAISEMIDFRKLHGASDEVFRKFSATELYLKRARETVAKMMRLQWTQDLDIETLEARGHWATMEELLEVVKFHLPRYENTVKICKSSPAQVNPSDLTFATKFVAMYLFIKVKGSRPMTYQYLTVDMIATGKEKGGFIDQKTFKTAGKYGFDSLILTDANMQVLNGYISYVRPLLKPKLTEMEANMVSWARSWANLCLMQLESTSIPRVIAKWLKRRASMSSLAKSRGFCRKTKNTALPLLKFTIKSNDLEKLL